MSQIAEEYVKCDGGTGMSQVSITVYCRSAYIHAYMRCVKRYE